MSHQLEQSEYISRQMICFGLPRRRRAFTVNRRAIGAQNWKPCDVFSGDYKRGPRSHMEVVLELVFSRYEELCKAVERLFDLVSPKVKRERQRHANPYCRCVAAGTGGRSPM